MSETEDPEKAWTDVCCHRPYHPYWFQGQRNPRFEKSTDGRLLDFKDGQSGGLAAAVADFRELLEKLKLPGGAILVIVPGHEAQQTNAGRPLANAAELLAASDPGFVAAPDALIRTVSVPKRADGGLRDAATQVQSIAVTTNLKGTTVVVLDDTVATGTSIEGVRQLLMASGAKRVAALALGRTVKYL